MIENPSSYFIIQPNVGDVVTYQPVVATKYNYERVHEVIGERLNILFKEAGDDLPLYVISNGLGSVIASNYFYDLQIKKA